MAKTALEFECPHCGQYGAYEVKKTEPNYCWQFGLLGERIVGKRVSYRRRVRECYNCGQRFATAEISAEFLRSLKTYVRNLEEKLDSIRETAKVKPQRKSKKALP